MTGFPTSPPSDDFCGGKGRSDISETAVSNFDDHAGQLTEMLLAGNLAVRLGKNIDWDTANLDARGLPEVKAMLKRSYRSGWEPQLA